MLASVTVELGWHLEELSRRVGCEMPLIVRSPVLVKIACRRANACGMILWGHEWSVHTGIEAMLVSEGPCLRNAPLSACRMRVFWCHGRCMGRTIRRPLRGTIALFRASGTPSWMRVAQTPASSGGWSASCLPGQVQDQPHNCMRVHFKPGMDCP